MEMDPVVVLAEEIRTAEYRMGTACKENAVRYSLTRAEEINHLLARIRALYTEILTTAPTSALGASVLIRIAAGRMPFAHARFAANLHRIADRLEAGQRLHGDLIWLRAIVDALAGDTRAEKAAALGTLIAMAIRGIAMPVVVFRAVTPPVYRRPEGLDLSCGPLRQ